MFHVREGIKVAKEYAIKNGPMFIEIETIRYHGDKFAKNLFILTWIIGHSMSESGPALVFKDEVQERRRTKDCIEIVRDILLENKLSTENDLKVYSDPKVR